MAESQPYLDTMHVLMQRPDHATQWWLRTVQLPAQVTLQGATQWDPMMQMNSQNLIIDETNFTRW
jgi:hypothetical protein